MRPLPNILIEMLFVGLFVLLIAKALEPVFPGHGAFFFIAVGAAVHLVFEFLGWNMQWCSSTFITRGS